LHHGANDRILEGTQPCCVEIEEGGTPLLQRPFQAGPGAQVETLAEACAGEVKASSTMLTRHDHGDPDLAGIFGPPPG